MSSNNMNTIKTTNTNTTNSNDRFSSWVLGSDPMDESSIFGGSYFLEEYDQDAGAASEDTFGFDQEPPQRQEYSQGNGQFRGGSLLSEILSCEIMERILGVRLLKTEMEIGYSFINQPMTDYLVSFHHPCYHTSLSIEKVEWHKLVHEKYRRRKDMETDIARVVPQWEGGEYSEEGALEDGRGV
ncbi:12897_t:CDS:2 [Acaulospora colombiana]|uniref:12897_t:CDS:1 n=1 Tax=Acaulospora colombiana TaxID=27376 RepID=A0ACA9KP00_9GLOM|nr:12897_t:CDS:2 [Acaulospora colombiana]